MHSACTRHAISRHSVRNQHAIRLDTVLHALANILTDRVDAHAHISTEGANAHISTEGHAHISTEGSNAFADRVDAVRGSSMQHPQTVADALAERLDTLPLIRANASPSMAN